MHKYFLRNGNNEPANMNAEAIPSWLQELLQSQEQSRLRQEETINKLIETLTISQQDSPLSGSNQANSREENST